MQYFLGDIKLDLTTGLISKDGQEKAVRAKTLQVLDYLIRHKDQIVTKQDLLSHIWHDVVVQEQVLVQSIKEIRNLLGSHVIKTYPRQGYQWTAELETVQPLKAQNHKTFQQTFLAISLVILVGIFWLMTHYNENSQVENKHNQFTIGFLPVENDIPDNIHHWVPLEGMEYLNHTLKQQSNLNVVNTHSMLKALGYRNIDNSLPLSNKQITNEQITQLKNNQSLTADLFVQTRLLGYPQDFLLQYTFYLQHSAEQGVIFSNDIADAFDQLIQKIHLRFGDKKAVLPPTTSNYLNNFSNAAFTRGMAFYQQRAYKQAMPLFTSALQDNPKLLVARRSLAASHINDGEIEQGISLLIENIEQAKILQDHREQIRSNLMLGVLLINTDSHSNEKVRIAEAEQYIEAARYLANKHQDKLFFAYTLEELGKIKRLQGLYQQAIELQKQALVIHQAFRGKYGQTTALIELARVAATQNDFSQANSYFNQATMIAENNGVATNKVAVLLAQADVEKLQGLTESANTLAQKAMAIAKQAKSDYLMTRVTAWLESKNHYEIN